MRKLSKEEKKWQLAVLSLEYCVKCGRHGVQWCHRNYGKGMGLKTEPWNTAALCQECHFEIDNGKSMSREQRRAEMDFYIVETHSRLIRGGVLKL